MQNWWIHLNNNIIPQNLFKTSGEKLNFAAMYSINSSQLNLLTFTTDTASITVTCKQRSIKCQTHRSDLDLVHRKIHYVQNYKLHHIRQNSDIQSESVHVCTCDKTTFYGRRKYPCAAETVTHNWQLFSDVLLTQTVLVYPQDGWLEINIPFQHKDGYIRNECPQQGPSLQDKDLIYRLQPK